MEPMMYLRTALVLALMLLVPPLAAGTGENEESDALMMWKERLEGFKADGKLSTWESSSSPSTDWEGVSCQGGSQITDISLDNQQIRGTLPKEFSVLERLSTLSLKFNFIAGEALPQEWSKLERLVLVNIADNELSGTLPADVSPFSRLQYLHMSNNNIRGPLPGNLARLQYISLESNQLSGNLQAWSSADVVSLKLPGNSITGGIPEEWAAGMSSLKFLELQDNLLSGKVAAALEPTLSGLEVLSIRDNELDEESIMAIARVQPEGSEWSLLPQRIPELPATAAPVLAPKESKPSPTNDPNSLMHLFEKSESAEPPSVVEPKGLKQWVILVIVGVSCIAALGAGIAAAVYFVCYNVKAGRRRSLLLSSSTKVSKMSKSDIMPPDDWLPPPSKRLPDAVADCSDDADPERGLAKGALAKESFLAILEQPPPPSPQKDVSKAFDSPDDLLLIPSPPQSARKPPLPESPKYQPVIESPRKFRRSTSSSSAAATPPLSRAQSAAFEAPSVAGQELREAIPRMMDKLEKLPPLPAPRECDSARPVSLPALGASSQLSTPVRSLEAKGLKPKKAVPAATKPLRAPAAMPHPEDSESEVVLEPQVPQNRRRSSVDTQDTDISFPSNEDMREEDVHEDELPPPPSPSPPPPLPRQKEQKNKEQQYVAEPPPYETGVAYPLEPLLGNFFRNESHEVLPPSGYFGAPKGSTEANDLRVYSSGSSRAPSSAGSSSSATRWLVAAPTQRVASSSSAIQKPASRGNSSKAMAAASGRPPLSSAADSSITARPATSAEDTMGNMQRLSGEGRPPPKRVVSAQGARSPAVHTTIAEEEGIWTPSRSHRAGGKQLNRSRSDNR